MPEITPFEPDLDNSSVGKRHIRILQNPQKAVSSQNGFFYRRNFSYTRLRIKTGDKS
jgi:hypothetical protein